MFWKIIILFLCLMVLVGMIGKVIFPSGMGGKGSSRGTVAKCRRCGRPLIGRTPCGCGKDKA